MADPKPRISRFHWLAHLFRQNFCEGIIDHDWPGATYDPITWRMGVRCLTCGKEKWFE